MTDRDGEPDDTGGQGHGGATGNDFERPSGIGSTDKTDSGHDDDTQPAGVHDHGEADHDDESEEGAARAT